MRREKEITIDEGDDKGKKFKITAMSAFQMDKWVNKALGAIGKETDENVFIYFFNLGIGGIIDAISKAEEPQKSELLAELLECCSFEKDGNFVVLKGNVSEGIIEDWKTYTRLRVEALNVNFDFLDEGDTSSPT